MLGTGTHVIEDLVARLLEEAEVRAHLVDPLLKLALHVSLSRVLEVSDDVL